MGRLRSTTGLVYSFLISRYSDRNLGPGLMKGNSKAAMPSGSYEAFSLCIARSVGKGQTDFLPRPNPFDA